MRTLKLLNKFLKHILIPLFERFFKVFGTVHLLIVHYHRSPQLEQFRHVCAVTLSVI